MPLVYLHENKLSTEAELYIVLKLIFDYLILDQICLSVIFDLDLRSLSVIFDFDLARPLFNSYITLLLLPIPVNSAL